MRVVRVMYLTDSDAPALSPNPLGVGLVLINAAALVLLFLGWGPLNKLTTSNAQMYLSAAQKAPESHVAQPPAAVSPDALQLTKN